ncbi:hypothetical protein RUM44_003701 [Polyplax serrata]|uniref:Glycophorin-A n=1 Tax=Polyplax serrata TaxID=468196 RepID=A0ABR1AH64_POLSC
MSPFVTAGTSTVQRSPSLTKLREEGVEVFGNETSHLTGEAREKMESMDPISDIILPSLVIGALLVGNIILIYIIYLQKKKLAQKEEHIKLQPITKGEVNNENI